MMVRALAFGLSLALVASCSSSSKNRAPRLAASGAVNIIPESGLGPQQLQPGECGLFLWSKTDVNKFIFFSRALSGIALFKQGDSALTLTQNGAGGDIFGQFNTDMSYASASGGSVQLTFDTGETLQGGQRIEDGLLTVTDAEGWRTKMPVLGVRACQPE